LRRRRAGGQHRDGHVDHSTHRRQQLAACGFDCNGRIEQSDVQYASTIGSVDFLLTDGKTACAFGSTASDTSYTRIVSTGTDGINWSARKVMNGPQDPSADFAVDSKGVLAVHGRTRIRQ
jgi:hypothetical protein